MKNKIISKNTYLENSSFVLGNILNHTITFEEAQFGTFTMDCIRFCCAPAW
jgi:hypothetical protein